MNPTARTATPPATPAISFHGSVRPPSAGVPPMVRRRWDAVIIDGRLSASENSRTVGNRSAGVSASAPEHAVSIVSGIDSRTIDGGDTISMECRAMTAWTVGPVKGGAPTSISYTTQARLY